MGYSNSKSVKFQEEFRSGKHHHSYSGGAEMLLKNHADVKQLQESSSTEKFETPVLGKTRISSKVRRLSRVCSEDYARVKRKILDPRGHTLRRWNNIFLAACLVSLFIDPFFFYLPSVWNEMCIEIPVRPEAILTTIRTMADVFYLIQIFMRFRTAYTAASSRVLGRGELVIDSSKIASRYLQQEFWIDLIAALPLPQVLIWVIIPNLRGSPVKNTKNTLRFILIFQYIPRLILVFPVTAKMVKTSDAFTKTCWPGAAYNLILYLLASHVIGAFWYLLSIERQEACWRAVCDIDKTYCEYGFFDCQMIKEPRREAWFQSSNITSLCNPDSNFYQFGIYGVAVTLDVMATPFFSKFFYSLWWGLNSLSCLGQNLFVSTYIGEVVFAIMIGILGLLLFALLIGDMQTYLQSSTIRLEEWRIKRSDTEEWMHHRQLPQELRRSVRRYHQYKWVATQGVDEEALLQALPLDLRRDIKRHLCLNLVRRVPLFEKMEERMLDAICERLKPSLCPEDAFLVREGDPVREMSFVIRGHLDSYTTNGGRSGFFNSCRIGPGDFCGEELLTWALDPRPSVIFPSSTRTVKAISEAEAFVLMAEDLTFVASQFRRLHSKQLRDKFRFYSHQWRGWAACFIQAAWRRYKKRKEEAAISARKYPLAFPELESPPRSSILTSLAATAATAATIEFSGSYSLQRPDDPE